MSREKTLRVSASDLLSTKVDATLAEEAALRAGVREAAPPLSALQRLMYASWLVLMLAGLAGGFVAWALIEPWIDDTSMQDEGMQIAATLVFPAVVAFVALVVGATEGLICRRIGRALFTGVVAGAIGFAGALVLLIPAGFFFLLATEIAAAVSPSFSDEGTISSLSVAGFLVMMIGRGGTWALLGVVAGIGQGVALREKKLVVNGIVGGALGGLLGGLLFDPIDALVGSPSSAAASRCVGLSVIGGSVGLFVGLVEQWAKTAWLFMERGALAGKQFIVYRNPTVIGSSPKADIYLFKDPAVEPRHALIHQRGATFEIEDAGTPAGTRVNGQPVRRHLLKSGDQIAIGKTVLAFALRDADGRGREAG